MNKRASKTMYEWTVDLVFILMVLIIFLSAAVKIKDTRLHNLRVEARDYAFTRDALSIYPNSFNYDYRIRENIVLQVNKESCQIQSRYLDDPTKPVVFPCGKDQTLRLAEQGSGEKVNIRNG